MKLILNFSKNECIKLNRIFENTKIFILFIFTFVLSQRISQVEFIFFYTITNTDSVVSKLLYCKYFRSSKYFRFSMDILLKKISSIKNIHFFLLSLMYQMFHFPDTHAVEIVKQRISETVFDAFVRPEEITGPCLLFSSK